MFPAFFFSSSMFAFSFSTSFYLLSLCFLFFFLSLLYYYPSPYSSSSDECSSTAINPFHLFYSNILFRALTSYFIFYLSFLLFYSASYLSFNYLASLYYYFGACTVLFTYLFYCHSKMK